MKPNIYVDLDGTLTPTDVLMEQILVLVKRNPVYVLFIFYWFFFGALRLKQELGLRVRRDLNALPFRPEVVAFLLQQKKSGHRIVLATAAWWEDAWRVANRLGFFDGVLASQEVNLKSHAKLQAILADSAHKPFIYLGDSKADLPIWQEACTAYAVAPSRSVLRAARRLGLLLLPLPQLHEQQEYRAWPGLAANFYVWLKAIRISQWAKNVLLFLPLLAAHRWDPALWLTCSIAFLAFGAVASGTYLLNDLLDLDADRNHPRKRFRPLANCLLSIQHASIVACGLLCMGFVLAFLGVGFAFGLWLLAYVLMTLIYSWRIKAMPLVDVVVLGLLYTMRVVAGGAATQIPPSGWLLGVCLFLFLSLALVKRCAELQLLRELDKHARTRGYRVSDLPYLIPVGITSGFAAVVILALYVESQNSSLLYQNPEGLWWVCPLVLLWLMRIWWLLIRRRMMDDPVHFALNDAFSWCLLFGVVGIAIWAT